MVKQAMGHIWGRDQILLTFDSLAGLPKWRNVKTSPNYSLKQTAMNNEFISEGRRKVIGPQATKTGAKKPSMLVFLKENETEDPK